MILVFDAECVLCSAWVEFVIRHDRNKIIQFAAIQGESGRRLLVQAGLDPDNLQTLLLVDGDRSWRYTAAIFRVLHLFGGIWRLAWVGWLVPSPVRDAAYRWAARNRYRLFGRRTACYVPSPADQQRFLDTPYSGTRPVSAC